MEPKEESVPDISLLSPEQQDRYRELADKLLADESSITPAEIEELNQLLKGLPLVGPHDKFGGPDLESVREHHLGLHSFRSMRRIEASLRKASALRLRHSQSLASLRHRPSQAKVRSTSQRFGSTTKRWA